MNEAYLHLDPLNDSANVLVGREIKQSGGKDISLHLSTKLRCFFTLRPAPEMSKQFNFLKERRYPIPTSVILGLPVRSSKVN